MPRDDNRPDLQEICRQCPTQTLRSQCPHTAEGREYLKQKRHPRQSTPESSRPPWFNYLSPSKSSSYPPPYNYPWPQAGPVPVYHHTPLQNAPAMLPPVSSQVISFPPTHGNSDATADLTSLTGASVAPSTILSTVASSNPVHSPDCSDDDERTPGTSGSNRRHRGRVTKKNALYGKVEGAMRGSKPYDILRMKELRPAITDQANASARFLRCASDIIERCERLSQETGCWLHFNAQHLFAHGGFLHYTSPRLLREAKKDAEQITNHASRVYATLIAARNEESKEMHKRLLLAEGDKQVAQEAERNALLQVEAARREQDLQNEELQAQRLELQALKAKLSLAERRNLNNTLQ